MTETSTILIVDDDQDTRNILRTILVGNSYKVDECCDGFQTLEKLQNFTPDLILLDIMMPGMSGYDVMVHLKQKPETQNIPIIMLTAKGEPEDLIKAYKDYAVDYYIPKPFTTRQLLAGISLILAQD